MTRHRRRWLWRVAFVASVIGCCVGFWWTCLRTEFSVHGARVSYQTGGTRGAVTFSVVDATGTPVPGMAVASESFSGWTQDGVTDAAGQAVIWPNEGEVLAVRVERTEVRFRPRLMEIEMQFAPKCHTGLLVHIVLGP